MSAPIYKSKGNKVLDREKAAGKSDKDEPKREAADAKEKKPAGDGGEGDDEPKGNDVGSRHTEERMAMMKRHISELKDHNNNHREALRQMHGRHEKDHNELNARHMGEMSEQSVGEATGKPEPKAEMAEPGGAGAAASA